MVGGGGGDVGGEGAGGSGHAWTAFKYSLNTPTKASKNAGSGVGGGAGVGGEGTGGSGHWQPLNTL